jgi:hypothetical protein
MLIKVTHPLKEKRRDQYTPKKEKRRGSRGTFGSPV